MRIRVLAVAAAVIFSGLGTAAAAQASTVTDVAMYSDTGDYIGQGEQQLFTSATDTITPSGNPGDISVNVDSPSGYTLEFAAPQGQTLQDGVYDGATRAAFRSGQQPGIDISGDGRGCDTDQGRFQIEDIHFDSNGIPDRLWLVFEQHCEGAVPALFGEVRINEPPDAGAGTFVPALVRWPVNGPGVPETVVPVQFVAAAAGKLGAASLAGSDPGDFTIREDDCNGQVLAVGQACDVYVRFVPTTPGLRTATLELTDGGGTVHSVPLQGWTYGGTTRLVMNSDAGDSIGEGQQYDFTPATDDFEASGSPDEFTFDLDSGNWTGSFHPPQGDIFTAGTTYTGAQRDAFRGSAAGMEVDGPGRGCNTISGDFQVVAATFAPDGTMETFAIKFDQYCDGATAGLHGEFDWREGDTTPRAPWMGPGGPCSPSSCSGGGPSGGSGGGGSGGGGSGGSGASGQSATSTTATPTAQGSTNSQGTGGSGIAQAKLRALKASLNLNDHRLQAALAELRRNPRNTRARLRAVAALGVLAQDLTGLRQLLSSAAPGAAHQAEGRRVLGALTTLSQILRAEQHALATHGAAGLAAALQVAHRNAARERKALAVLAAAS